MENTKRKPTPFEIDCAKVLRGIGGKSKVRNNDTYWMQECYFDIQDNGIDDFILYKMARLIKRDGNRKQYAMAEKLVPKPVNHSKEVLNKAKYQNVYSAVGFIVQSGYLGNIERVRDEHVFKVLEMVCDKMCLNIDDVLSKSRRHEFVTARIITANLFTNKSTLEDMAKFLRRVNHTSIIHYHKVFQERIGSSEEYYTIYKTIKQKTGL